MQRAPARAVRCDEQQQNTERYKRTENCHGSVRQILQEKEGRTMIYLLMLIAIVVLLIAIGGE